MLHHSTCFTYLASLSNCFIIKLVSLTLLHYSANFIIQLVSLTLLHYSACFIIQLVSLTLIHYSACFIIQLVSLALLSRSPSGRTYLANINFHTINKKIVLNNHLRKQLLNLRNISITHYQLIDQDFHLTPQLIKIICDKCNLHLSQNYCYYSPLFRIIFALLYLQLASFLNILHNASSLFGFLHYSICFTRFAVESPS